MPTASAQPTAANIAIVSGNGQLSCTTCGFKNFRTFYPLVVKVTDANGKPIANKTVNWQVTSSVGAPGSVSNPTSATDINGIAAMPIFPGNQNGTANVPFLQSTVVASADGAPPATFTFTEALTNPNAGNVQLVFSLLVAPTPDASPFGPAIGGPAGSTGSAAPIRVHIDGQGVPLPNVSVRLLNLDPKNLPSATCATQAGADPGSVLTDGNGDAVCNPVFGTVPGRDTVDVLVGGLDPAEFDQTASPIPLTAAVAYDQYAGIILTVTPVTAGLLQISSGNNQSVNPGQPTVPLVVRVTDAAGAIPVGNEKVSWSVTPSTGAFLNATTTTSDASGLASTTLALTPSAFGQYTIRAALASNSNVFTTFTVNTNIQISSLAKVSGDLQSVAANLTFGAPLVVLVNGSNGLPVQNVGINFSLSGPGTLSANSAFTDTTGRASIGVKATGTAGTITVVATVANTILSQSFTLTVVPPGPAVTAASFLNAAGRNAALSPCSLATVVAPGLNPGGGQGLVLPSNSFGPWPTTLAGDTVTVNNVAAPIVSLGTVNGLEQVTFQVPCETAVGSVPVTIGVSGGSATSTLTLTAASPGIYETVMNDNVRRAVVVRPDGTFVSLTNPARRGEIVRVFVTGMGPTIPAVGTGALPVPGSDALVSGQVIVGINNGGTPVITSRLSPDLIGVYEIAFLISSDAPAGNDIVLSVAVNVPGDPQTRFSNASKIPIQ